MTKTNTTMRLFAPLAVLLAAFTLSACDLHEEGNITKSRVQVEEKTFVEKIPVGTLSDDYAAALAHQYERYGDGGVDLTVAYDPTSRSNTAMSASTQAARIASVFRKNGVDHVETNILPVNGQGAKALAVITYTSYNALAPKDCGVLPGFEDTNIDFQEDYKLGCTVETAFARQIARPKDLKRSAADTYSDGDGRRASNVVDVYRTGIPSEPLDGESSSGDE